MTNTIDTRGLSCPQPVIAVMAGIKRVGNGELIVLVDTETAKENIDRALPKGWSVIHTQSTEYGYELKISNAQ